MGPPELPSPRVPSIVLRLLVSQMKSVGVASIVSLGLHGALALAMLHAPTGVLGSLRPNLDPVAIEILPPEVRETPEIEPIAEPLPPAPHAEEPAPPDASERPRRDGPTEAEPSEATEPTEPGPTEPRIEVPDVAPSRTPSTFDPHSPSIAALIAPGAVARGAYTITGPGPSRPGPPAGLGTSRGHGRSEAEIERDLQDGLRRQAMAKGWITREPVVPRRQSDGSYTWSGHVFTARIAPDGDVTFNDQPGISTDGFSASGRFDLEGAIMGAQGGDVHRAERDRFMRETEELRHRLEDQHRRATMTTGLRRLRGRLSGVWATETRSYESRRRRIFDIWDEMAEDGDGEAARRIVIRFIREVLPAGSENAYTSDELTRFNASRASAERFAPY